MTSVLKFNKITKGIKAGELRVVMSSNKGSRKTTPPASMLAEANTPEKMQYLIDLWYGPGTYANIQWSKEIEG